MKVILRIQKGIMTNSIDIPDNCVKIGYYLPFYRPMNAKFIGDAQDLITSSVMEKCLRFEWNGRDTLGNYPIMDLIEVR
jgi:hypothetical protein